jgi:hypothetical protein
MPDSGIPLIPIRGESTDRGQTELMPALLQGPLRGHFALPREKNPRKSSFR